MDEKENAWFLIPFMYVQALKKCTLFCWFLGEKNVASPFENLMSSTHDMAVWEPFRNNVDMDVQVCILLFTFWNLNIQCGVKERIVSGSRWVLFTGFFHVVFSNPWKSERPFMGLVSYGGVEDYFLILLATIVKRELI